MKLWVARPSVRQLERVVWTSTGEAAQNYFTRRFKLIGGGGADVKARGVRRRQRTEGVALRPA